MEDLKTPEQLKAPSLSSNLNSNVRTRVNEWVSSFVTEMRSKRPVVQKFVDSVPTGTSASDTSDKAEPVGLTAPIAVAITPDCLNGHDFMTKDNSIPTAQLICLNLQQPPPIKVTAPKSGASVEADALSPNAIKFWHKRPAILSTLSKSGLERFYNNRSADASTTPEPSTSNVTVAVPQRDESNIHSIRMIGKAKFNELYNKLSISRNKFNSIRDRRMEAKQLIEEAKERLSASRAKLAKETEDDDGAAMDEQQQKQMASIKVCDNLDMDISLDELSHMSRSTENISADDSLTMSMPSIDDGPAPTPAQHLNVGRRIAIGEIGRSTSDNPRLRHKFHLGDIGRSFSENQDDEAIVIGERNISAPSSSIAIENNNRGHSGYLERRAYSVSPTQNNVRRGILFRDQSLNERSTSRASGGATLHREGSLQSDSSRCSSVESLLDARRPDSEAILRHLGFGPVQQEDLLSKIPKRFLKPSQVRGIDTEAFLRQQLIASNIHEQAILGYRGLVGNPHVAPSLIVAKLMERFQLNEERSNKVMDVINGNRSQSAPSTPRPNSHDPVESS